MRTCMLQQWAWWNKLTCGWRDWVSPQKSCAQSLWQLTSSFCRSSGKSACLLQHSRSLGKGAERDRRTRFSGVCSITDLWKLLFWCHQFTPPSSSKKKTSDRNLDVPYHTCNTLPSFSSKRYKVLSLFNRGNNKDLKWCSDFASVLQKLIQRLVAEPRSFQCHSLPLGCHLLQQRWKGMRKYLLLLWKFVPPSPEKYWGQNMFKHFVWTKKPAHSSSLATEIRLSPASLQ